jgi:signal transduction histidine kinase
MEDVRVLTREIRSEEIAQLQTKTTEWVRAQKVSRLITASGSVLNVILILAAGALVTRDLRRRTAVAIDLESQVNKATTELSELSTYLQRISEREKSQLARELHDELGGLLIAIKMDLAQLRSQIDLTKLDIKTRWERVQTTLSAGIDLKRRVIEQLRPSLLDNMGLVSALQWQAGEICKRANLTLTEHYPDDVPDVSPDAAIAIFRIAQESLTNVVKHAQATAVEITLTVVDDRLMLCIDDNGVGLDNTRVQATGAHGIAGMRHRLKSYQGEFKIETKPTRGTRVTAGFPCRMIVKRSDAA